MVTVAQHVLVYNGYFYQKTVDHMEQDTRIGDFSRPLAAKTPASPVKEALDDAERALSAEVKSVEAELRPMASYEEKLKEAGITREEAARVIDDVLMRGYYAEDVKITRSIRARFRTRNARDIRRAQDQIELARPTYEAHYQEILSRHLLAASLEQFGNDKLRHPDRRASQDDVEKAFADRLSYVDTLSDPALRLLMTKLVAFDRKVSVVLEEGALESF